ncbi:MAG: sodium:calcium antiporter [Adhaeribacter sp.]
MITVWLLEFAALAGLIFFSGRQLSVYGSILAELLGLGKAWIGLALMASVTSLPELTVGISSAAVVGSADLALGDVLGSCCFNLFLLAVMDALLPGKSLSSQASTSHILAGAMSIILVALVGLGMLLPEPIFLSKWIGLSSLAFVVVYFLSMRLLYRFELKIFQQQAAREKIREQEVPVTLKRALLTYAVHAGVVVGAAMLLPGLARNLAEETGLGESFVGTLFLAASTSLPEAAVSISAIRMGAYDLAIGNLIGSNMFNIIILAIDDFFYTQGHLLKDAAPGNMITVFSVLIMTALAIAGLMYRSKRKLFFLAWDALLIGAVYVANLVLLYYLRPAG